MPQESISDSKSPVRHILFVEGNPARCVAVQEAFAHYRLCVDVLDTAESALGVVKHRWPGIMMIGHPVCGTSPSALADSARAIDAPLPILVAEDDATPQQLLDQAVRCLAAAPKAAPVEPGPILLVDDDERLRNILQSFLELNRFEVAVASSGEELLERLETVSPRLVLLDLRMPGIGGLDALRGIRQVQPNLPVIIITYVDEEHTRTMAADWGANDYLLKPLSFEHLRTILHSRIWMHNGKPGAENAAGTS